MTLLFLLPKIWNRIAFEENDVNASEASEHPPSKRRENVKTSRLGGDVGCTDKISSWHLIGFPHGSCCLKKNQNAPRLVSHIQRIGCHSEKLLHTVASPARGLLNREKRTKYIKSGSIPPLSPPILLVRRKNK